MELDKAIFQSNISTPPASGESLAKYFILFNWPCFLKKKKQLISSNCPKGSNIILLYLQMWHWYFLCSWESDFEMTLQETTSYMHLVLQEILRFKIVQEGWLVYSIHLWYNSNIRKHDPSTLSLEMDSWRKV